MLKVLSVTPVKRRQYVTANSNKPVGHPELKPGEISLVSVHGLPRNNPRAMDLLEAARMKQPVVKLDFDTEE